MFCLLVSLFDRMARRTTNPASTSKQLEVETAQMELRLQKLREERAKVLARMDESKPRWSSATSEKPPVKPAAGTAVPQLEKKDPTAELAKLRRALHHESDAKLVRPTTAGRRDLVSSDSRSWSVNQVVDWLKVIGLDRYAATFNENEVDGRTLLEMSNADLDYLGIKPLAHRKIILKGVEQLKDACDGDRDMGGGVGSEVKSPAAPKPMVHWSHLEPISDRQVEHVDSDVGTDTAQNLLDGAYDERAAAASFQAAVMAWRHQTGRGDVKGADVARSTIVAEDDGDGAWTNPFASVTTKAKDSPIKSQSTTVGKVQIVREDKDVESGVGSTQSHDLRDGVYDEEAERRAFQAAVQAWREGKTAENAPAPAAFGTSAESILPEKLSCYHCFKVYLPDSGFVPGAEQTEADAAVSGLKLEDKRFCSESCYNATRIALQLLRVEISQPNAQASAQEPPTESYRSRIQELQKLVEDQNSEDEVPAFPAMPVKEAPAADLRNSDVLAFGSGHLRASPIQADDDPLADMFASVAGAAEQLARAVSKPAARPETNANASSKEEDAEEEKSDDVSPMKTIDAWTTDFNRYI